MYRTNKITRYDIKYGVDLEFFVKDENKNIVSLPSAIIGSKKNPIRQRNGGVLHKDNALLEIATPPCYSVAQLIKNVSWQINDVMNFLPKGHTLFASSYQDIDREILRSDKENMSIGCNPVSNAYGRKFKQKLDKTGRGAGLHIHMSPVHKDHVKDLIKQLDVSIGMPSLFMDEDCKRRETFGRAGNYRARPLKIKDLNDYRIVEYRVLGAFMLKHLDKVMNEIDYEMKSMINAEAIISNDANFQPEWNAIIEECINNYDTDQLTTLFGADYLLYLLPDMFKDTVVEDMTVKN